MKYDVPLHPPAAWFSPPFAGIPTDKRITITASGRVYGYIALWNTCHVGFNGTCIKPPRGSDSNYEYAHQGETETEEGTFIKTAVIAGGSDHAPLDAESSFVPKYYENTGTQLMRVRYGEDDNGLWFSGALWPNVDDLQIAHIRASAVSGDWRFHAAFRRSSRGNMDFAGACFVNIPGFPMPVDGYDNQGSPQNMRIAASAFMPIQEDEEVLYIMTPDPIIAGALPYKESKKADPGLAWSADPVEKQLDTKEKLRMANAWVDPKGDPNAKSSYKLPHHLANGEVVLRGVEAAMGALLGARGGVSIPASDKQAVYNHLAKHYKQFGKTPPALTATGADMEEEGCTGNPEDCGCNGDCNNVETDLINDIESSLEKIKAVRAAATAPPEMSDAERISALESVVKDLIQTNNYLRDWVDHMQADAIAAELAGGSESY